MLLPGSDDEIIGVVSTQNPMHSIYIVACIPPIDFCLQISQDEFASLPFLDIYSCLDDLHRYEFFAPVFRFMVIEYSHRSEHIVLFPVVSAEREPIQLGDPIDAVGAERYRFVLNFRVRISEDKRRGSVEEFGFWRNRLDRFQGRMMESG